MLGGSVEVGVERTSAGKVTVVDALTSEPPRTRGLRAGLGAFIALLSIPAVFFLGSMSLVFTLIGGALLGSSLAANRGITLRVLLTLMVVAGTVAVCALLLWAIL